MFRADLRVLVPERRLGDAEKRTRQQRGNAKVETTIRLGVRQVDASVGVLRGTNAVDHYLRGFGKLPEAAEAERLARRLTGAGAGEAGGVGVRGGFSAFG